MKELVLVQSTRKFQGKEGEISLLGYVLPDGRWLTSSLSPAECAQALTNRAIMPSSTGKAWQFAKANPDVLKEYGIKLQKREVLEVVDLNELL